MLLQSIKVGAVDPAGKTGRPGGDPLGGGIGQCGPGRLVHADGAGRSRAFNLFGFYLFPSSDIISRTVPFELAFYVVSFSV